MPYGFARRAPWGVTSIIVVLTTLGGNREYPCVRKLERRVEDVRRVFLSVLTAPRWGELPLGQHLGEVFAGLSVPRDPGQVGMEVQRWKGKRTEFSELVPQLSTRFSRGSRQALFLKALLGKPIAVCVTCGGMS